MKQISVLLDSIDKVRSFVALAAQYPYELDLEAGRYRIDAKSIMGIFSLDLTRPLELQIHCDDSESCGALLRQLSPYLAAEGGR